MKLVNDLYILLNVLNLPVFLLREIQDRIPLKLQLLIFDFDEVYSIYI